MRTASEKKRGGRVIEIVASGILVDARGIGCGEAPQAEAGSKVDRARLWQAGKQDGPINCVYFAHMEATDAVKIGFTHSGRQRLYQFNCSSPFPVRYEAYINYHNTDEAFVAEGIAHKIAAEVGKHVKGEWFVLDADQVTIVCERLFEETKDYVVGGSWKGMR